MDNFDYDVVWWRSSGLYCCATSRYQLKTVLLDKNPTAGALAITHKIANYPVYLARSVGSELLDWMRQGGGGCVQANCRFSDRCRRYSEKPQKVPLRVALWYLRLGQWVVLPLFPVKLSSSVGSELLRYLRCSFLP